MINIIKTNLKKREKKLYDIICFFSVIYSVIDISFSFLFKNDGLMTLYFITSIVILISRILLLSKERIILSYKTFFTFAILLLINIWIWLIDKETYTRSQCLVFSFGIIMLNTCSIKGLIDYCIAWISRNKKFILIAKVTFYFVIILSLIRGDGIQDAWDTRALSGPYETCHVLAYELLLWLIIDAFYVIKEKNTLFFVLFFLDAGLIVLTAARVVLIAVLLVFIMVFYSFPIRKRLLLVSAVIITMFVVINYSGIFTAFIEKTNRALSTSTITSGRGMIFISSIKAYFSSPWMQKIMGMGTKNLENYNYMSIWMAIHAHNDYIDALVQYGAVGLLLYLNSFASLIKRSRAFLGAAIIISLAFFNGYYISTPAIMGTVLILAFGKMASSKRLCYFRYIKEK